MSAVLRVVCVAALALAMTACGGASDGVGNKTVADESGDKDPNPNTHVSKVPNVGDDDDDGEISIVGTKGTLTTQQIDAGMAPHLNELTNCYTKKLGRRGYIGGELVFAFVVAADGTVDKAFLKRSTLGAVTMEQCMLDVARKMRFRKPSGGKPAEFTKDIKLTGTRATTWWDEERGTKEVADKVATLKACAKSSTEPSNVWVTLYVGTRGKILSVGFGSPAGPIAAGWAKCAEAAVAKWQLTDPRGRIAKAGFRYNAE